jgi:hypothetical protein
VLKYWKARFFEKTSRASDTLPDAGSLGGSQTHPLVKWFDSAPATNCAEKVNPREPEGWPGVRTMAGLARACRSTGKILAHLTNLAKGGDLVYGLRTMNGLPTTQVCGGARTGEVLVGGSCGEPRKISTRGDQQGETARQSGQCYGLGMSRARSLPGSATTEGTSRTWAEQSVRKTL